MAQYTREQKFRLTTLSGDIIMATLLVDVTDRVGVLREFRNAMKSVEDAKKAYPHNALIQDMTPGIEESIQDILGYTHAQRKTVRNTYLTHINEALVFLQDDAETKEFKEVLVNLAQKVAAAAGFGIFGSGEKVSLAEASFIQQLKQNFGI